MPVNSAHTHTLVFVKLIANIFNIQSRNIVFVQHQFYRGDKRIKQQKNCTQT